jgi:hypothetical protein
MELYPFLFILIFILTNPSSGATATPCVQIPTVRLRSYDYNESRTGEQSLVQTVYNQG